MSLPCARGLTHGWLGQAAGVCPIASTYHGQGIDLHWGALHVNVEWTRSALKDALTRIGPPTKWLPQKAPRLQLQRFEQPSAAVERGAVERLERLAEAGWQTWPWAGAHATG